MKIYSTIFLRNLKLQTLYRTQIRDQGKFEENNKVQTNVLFYFIFFSLNLNRESIGKTKVFEKKFLKFEFENFQFDRNSIRSVALP